MTEHEGQHLGSYRLLKLLGQDSFAEVYLGEHIHVGTQAAIKLFSTPIMEEDEIVLFKQGARALAHLVHPSIVRVLAFGTESSTNKPYLVMDYAPGGTLRQRHPRGTRLPLSTVIAYMKQVAAALQYAHDEQVLHRDVKPENMLLGRNGEVLLSDFGIALLARSSRFQNAGDMANTIAYMSPEQIDAHPCPASDQYALAMVVYEWLAGTLPFNDSLSDGDTSHSSTPPPLRDHLPTLSLAVELVVMTALARKPEDRFGSVRAFATALESAITIQIASERSKTVTRRGISRRTMLLSASGVVGVVLVGTGIGLRIRTPASTIPSQHSSPSQHSTPPTSQSQGTLYVLYGAHTNYVEAVAWSPDGKRIASGSGDYNVDVWDAVNGGNAFAYSGHTNWVYAVAWSPDNKRIASGSYDTTVQVWDATNGRHDFTYRGHASRVLTVAWSPDGKRIASGGYDSTTQVWDAVNGDHVFTYRQQSSQQGFNLVNAVAWSPDGKRIASGGYDGTTQVWDATNGGHVFTYRGHYDWVNTVAWSPDEKRIVSGSRDDTVQVWDAVNGGHVFTYRGHSGAVRAVAWSPDGKRIASGSADNTVQVWLA